MVIKRKYPIGAEVILSKGVHYRVWAPNHSKVRLQLEHSQNPTSFIEMNSEGEGYFSILSTESKPGTPYRFLLGDEESPCADPASRYQPFGPFGPSEVVDSDFSWSDKTWPGIKIEGQIIYEMHIGTFTEQGTFKAAAAKLPELVDLGITLIELMPLNEFVGRFGWGYDGVNLYAPYHVYGTPDDVKHFINIAHGLGLGVILDVVYNHFGPEGNQMLRYAEEYLDKGKTTDWGGAINFDSIPVREFFLTNIAYWIDEYHFDGLRLDATPWIFSSTPRHVLAEMTMTAKKAAKHRSIIIIGENEQQDSNLLRSYEEGGYGFDALWNDDFHHTALVRLIGKREAYYTDYLGSPQEFISSFKYGFLYQGQYYDWQKQPRGTPHLNLPPASMVIFLENHDQMANTAQGRHLNYQLDAGILRALTSVLLLSPNTPLIFQGQEFGSKSPFHYFADLSESLSKAVEKGRKDFLSQFPRLETEEILDKIPPPADPMTFAKCKLDLKEKDGDDHHQIFQLHKDLMRLRKEDPVFKTMQKGHFDGAVLSHDSFLIRYFGGESGDRLLIINFGADHIFNPAPEPLLVAGPGMEWDVLWSSESPVYGGGGTPPINIPYWKIIGHSAIVLKTQKVKST